MINCSARTELDTLGRHVQGAKEFGLVAIVPELDADVPPYEQFVQYLGEKRRAGVAKLPDGSTLFLVPPSDFSLGVLRVPRNDSLFGVYIDLVAAAPPRPALGPQALPVDGNPAGPYAGAGAPFGGGPGPLRQPPGGWNDQRVSPTPLLAQDAGVGVGGGAGQYPQEVFTTALSPTKSGPPPPRLSQAPSSAAPSGPPVYRYNPQGPPPAPVDDVRAAPGQVLSGPPRAGPPQVQPPSRFPIEQASARGPSAPVPQQQQSGRAQSPVLANLPPGLNPDFVASLTALLPKQKPEAGASQGAGGAAGAEGPGAPKAVAPQLAGAPGANWGLQQQQQQQLQPQQVGMQQAGQPAAPQQWQHSPLPPSAQMSLPTPAPAGPHAAGLSAGPPLLPGMPQAPPGPPHGSARAPGPQGFASQPYSGPMRRGPGGVPETVSLGMQSDQYSRPGPLLSGQEPPGRPGASARDLRPPGRGAGQPGPGVPPGGPSMGQPSPQMQGLLPSPAGRPFQPPGQIPSSSPQFPQEQLPQPPAHQSASAASQYTPQYPQQSAYPPRQQQQQLPLLERSQQQQPLPQAQPGPQGQQVPSAQQPMRGTGAPTFGSSLPADGQGSGPGFRPPFAPPYPPPQSQAGPREPSQAYPSGPPQNAPYPPAGLRPPLQQLPRPPAPVQQSYPQQQQQRPPMQEPAYSQQYGQQQQHEYSQASVGQQQHQQGAGLPVPGTAPPAGLPAAPQQAPAYPGPPGAYRGAPPSAPQTWPQQGAPAAGPSQQAPPQWQQPQGGQQGANPWQQGQGTDGTPHGHSLSPSPAPGYSIGAGGGATAAAAASLAEAAKEGPQDEKFQATLQLAAALLEQMQQKK